MRKQPVVKYYVGALHEAQSAEGTRSGSPRPASHQINFSLGLARIEIGSRERGLKLLSRLLLTAGEEAIGDRAFEDPLPKAPAQHGAADAGADALAIGAGKGDEAPVGGGNNTLQPRANHSCEHRRDPSRRDSDHKRIAIDDGWHDKVAQVRSVRDIDGNLGLPGEIENRPVRRRVARCAKDQGAALNCGQSGRALHMRKAIAGGDGPEVAAQDLAENANARTCP